MMRHSSLRLLAVLTLAGGGTVLAPRARAQSPAPRADDSPPIRPPSDQPPPPSTHRPRGVTPARQPPTPAVIEPMQPATTPPDSITLVRGLRAARIRGDGSADAGTTAPPPLAPLPLPTPPPRATAASVSLAPALREEPAPPNATGRCQDGSYAVTLPVESACAGRGGMVVAFPPSKSPPRP